MKAPPAPKLHGPNACAERSIGLIVKESSDLRRRLKNLSFAIVIASGLCAVFSVAAHEVGLSLNSVATLRGDCRSIVEGPCLYHDFAPTKTNQVPPPSSSNSTYDWTLRPYLLSPTAGFNGSSGNAIDVAAALVSAAANGSLSWRPRLATFSFPFINGLPIVNALRACASAGAVAAAAFRLYFGHTLLDLETLSGACAQRGRVAAAAAALGAPPAARSSPLILETWARIWNSGKRMRVSRPGCCSSVRRVAGLTPRSSPHRCRCPCCTPF